MTTKTSHFWENDNGTIYCEEHAGNYLRCGIKAEPKAKTHHTPLGTWTLMSRQDVTDFEAFLLDHYGREVSCCEGCRG